MESNYIKALKHLSFIGISLLTLPSVAVEMSDPATLLSARSQARGGATSASAMYHDSLFQNPASSAFSKQYAVSVGYLGWGDSLAASIVDTQSGPVGGGLYYVRRDLRDAAPTSKALGDFARLEEHMGLSLMGKMSSKLGVGTSVRYTYRRVGENVAVESGNAWNFDVGARYLLSPNISIGLIAQNLMADTLGVYPKRVVGAIEFAPISQLMLSAQIFKISTTNLSAGFSLPDSTQLIGYNLGVEYAVAQGVVLRGGYVSNPTWQQTLLTTGAGYQSQEFSIDYAFQKGLINKDDNVHTVSLTGFF